MTDLQAAAKLKSFKRKLGYIQPKSHNVIIGGKVWGRCDIGLDITLSFVKNRPKKSSEK
jgi:hypothetical protein